MTIRVNLFAGLREAADIDAINIAVADQISVADLIECVAVQIPNAAALVRYSRVASDNTYLADDQIIAAGSCCDLIPPVSGG